MLLGASGDLSGRLLLPALGQLLAQEPDRDVVLVGAGTEEWSPEDWRERVRSSLATADVDADTSETIMASTRYVQADVTDVEDLRRLVAEGPPAPAIYFALPPAVSLASCEALRSIDLPAGTVLALEKPFGTDAASAAALNRAAEPAGRPRTRSTGSTTSSAARQSSTSSACASPTGCSSRCGATSTSSPSTVVYDEQLALENRARYYDRAGALVDMIQSHLLQVMALVAMEPPAS